MCNVNKTLLLHEVAVDDCWEDEDIDVRLTWCKHNCVGAFTVFTEWLDEQGRPRDDCCGHCDTGFIDQAHFQFEREQDAMWFSLRWKEYKTNGT